MNQFLRLLATFLIHFCSVLLFFVVFISLLFSSLAGLHTYFDEMYTKEEISAKILARRERSDAQDDSYRKQLDAQLLSDENEKAKQNQREDLEALLDDIFLDDTLFHGDDDDAVHQRYESLFDQRLKEGGIGNEFEMRSLEDVDSIIAATTPHQSPPLDHGPSESEVLNPHGEADRAYDAMAALDRERQQVFALRVKERWQEDRARKHRHLEESAKERVQLTTSEETLDDARTLRKIARDVLQGIEQEYRDQYDIPLYVARHKDRLLADIQKTKAGQRHRGEVSNVAEVNDNGEVSLKKAAALWIDKDEKRFHQHLQSLIKAHPLPPSPLFSLAESPVKRTGDNGTSQHEHPDLQHRFRAQQVDGSTKEYDLDVDNLAGDITRFDFHDPAERLTEEVDHRHQLKKVFKRNLIDFLLFEEGEGLPKQLHTPVPQVAPPSPGSSASPVLSSPPPLPPTAHKLTAEDDDERRDEKDYIELEEEEVHRSFHGAYLSDIMEEEAAERVDADLLQSIPCGNEDEDKLDSISAFLQERTFFRKETRAVSGIKDDALTKKEHIDDDHGNNIDEKDIAMDDLYSRLYDEYEEQNMREEEKTNRKTSSESLPFVVLLPSVKLKSIITTHSQPKAALASYQFFTPSTEGSSVGISFLPSYQQRPVFLLSFFLAFSIMLGSLFLVSVSHSPKRAHGNQWKLM